MNLIGKGITWLYRKTMIKEMKKNQEVQKSDQDKKRDEMYRKLKELYNFVDWLNKKALPNRRARKTFWRRIANNENVMEETIKNIMKAYEQKEENPKEK